MKVNVSFTIEIDENKYPNLTKKQIREIVKQSETGGGCKDYIEEMSKSELESQNYENQ